MMPSAILLPPFLLPPMQNLISQFGNPILQNRLLPLVARSFEDSSPKSSTDVSPTEHKSTAAPTRNRYGRAYISGRPLLSCDRRKIVELYQQGMKKITIAKTLGITHSCVSKVLRRFEETGLIEARMCRTASCSCPGSSNTHDIRYCRHLRQNTPLFFSIENILSSIGRVRFYSKEANVERAV